MRHLLTALLAVTLLAVTVWGWNCLDQADGESASWNLLEILSVLARERVREQELVRGLPHVMARQKAESDLIDELSQRRVSLPEAMKRICQVRSSRELATLLARLRYSAPGHSDDERLGRHLIDVVKERDWLVRHSFLKREGPPMEGWVAELEAELEAHLQGGQPLTGGREGLTRGAEEN
jgi:hypothetical protein